MLNNKSILITGGTGSLGKALTKEILTKYPQIKQIIIYSRNEQKQYEMAQEALNWGFEAVQIQAKIRFVIGDIRDIQQLRNACKNKGQNIDIIIHAAALKHIDLAENNPLECIKTNIGGAENIIEVVQNLNIQTIIAISTDKACSPTSVYGASKLCADRLFVDANNENSKFSVVRYANFFASVGSVVPFFQKEKEKNILPITHIETTRFSLTMQEATEIALDILEKSLEHSTKNTTENSVANSAEKSFGGEIFVPKLRSYKITDLATAIAPKAALNIIGLRQGEKIHEEMLNATEANCAFETEKYYIIAPKKQLLESYKKHYNGKEIPANFSLISHQNHSWISQNELLEMMENI